MTWRGISGQSYTLAEFERFVDTIDFTGRFIGKFVVLHNTAVPNFASWHNVPGPTRMKALERYYRDDKGWSAGPHLFVADDLIWVFTPLNVRGTHSPSWNSVAWGVETVGDYESETLTTAVLSNVVGALTALHWVGKLDPSTLRLHREDPLTDHACPGKNLKKQPVVDAIRAHLGGLPDFSDVTIGGTSTAPAVVPEDILPTIGLGSQDAQANTKLQKLLGMQVVKYGTFGPQTEARLKEFQAANGLVPDGLAGPNTWRKLKEMRG